jgi:hypothetical protein
VDPVSGDKAVPERNGVQADRPVTYLEASEAYLGTYDPRKRFDELTRRQLMVAAEITLKARGEYDPQKYGPEGRYSPLTATEHLELLAAGEVLARYYRHPSRIHEAATAGATWQQIADATGTTPGRARQAYREWADGQHRVWQQYEGRFGMDEADHAAALERASGPDAEAAS